jgi:hypothetical protein
LSAEKEQDSQFNRDSCDQPGTKQCEWRWQALLRGEPFKHTEDQRDQYTR